MAKIAQMIVVVGEVDEQRDHPDHNGAERGAHERDQVEQGDDHRQRQRRGDPEDHEHEPCGKAGDVACASAPPM